MTKHVLPIDGGGIRGILPLALLTEVEARRGPCADLFDIVAGTSIGGIIATGLAQSYRRILVTDWVRRQRFELAI